MNGFTLNPVHLSLSSLNIYVVLHNYVGSGRISSKPALDSDNLSLVYSPKMQLWMLEKYLYESKLRSVGELNEIKLKFKLTIM